MGNSGSGTSPLRIFVKKRNFECLSLGVDTAHVLHGRSRVMIYADFMKNFRAQFENDLGETITVRVHIPYSWFYPSPLPKKNGKIAKKQGKLGKFQIFP